jgi:hypothetical protein
VPAGGIISCFLPAVNDGASTPHVGEFGPPSGADAATLLDPEAAVEPHQPDVSFANRKTDGDTLRVQHELRLLFSDAIDLQLMMSGDLTGAQQTANRQGPAQAVTV